ncbi:hypothetical protein [Cellulomonas sp. URHD0024]|uniref:hypothetical protein n=1 Tax=Cellulomonas sp. URHD0024 TaxID=1302620 RepID=UPI0004244160|nr:hypothetical protein [Cellulomonas sp. URHD0024]
MRSSWHEPGEAWELPPSDLFLPTLFGGVMTSAVRDVTDVVAVLRSAVELVVGWIGVEVSWSTRYGDEVQLTDEFWAGLTEIDDLFGLRATCTQLAAQWSNPHHTIAMVGADVPYDNDEAGRLIGQTSVRLSMQRWAMYGSGENLPWFSGALDRWMTQSAVALGADTGYAVLDIARSEDVQSAWETRIGMSQVFRDPTDRLWGVGWGTLLSSKHLDRVGGTAPVEAIPGARVRPLPGGRVWVTLGDDPSAIAVETMRRLQAALEPALPPADGNYHIPTPAPGGSIFTDMSWWGQRPPTADEAVARWRLDAYEALTSGRSTQGTFGPVGFTVAAGVTELLATADEPGLASFRFRDLGDEIAARLLHLLGPEVLDAPDGSGPTLGNALRAAVAHPGVVLLTGHATGPSSDDERIVVDGLRIRHDPVLDRTDPTDLAAAWRRVVELGIDDALARPDELRAPSTQEPDGDPEAWTVWWD